MSVSKRFQEVRNGFSTTFWIANTLELFERFAFYGSKAVLVMFLATKVGLTNDAGKLAGIFSGVIFALPVLTGVLVDRYGFRKTLLSCFAVFSVGYFLIALAGMEFGQEIISSIGKKTYVTGVLILTAMGGSLIKPCIVGTVARTSQPNVKSLGFSIYYTLVNLGGAIGPVIALSIRHDFGIEYVLVMSSVTSLLLLIGTFFFFNEPAVEDSGEAKRTFQNVFSDMIMVFSNFRFVMFLVIFSGFWLMFWQLYYSFPFYVTDVLKYPNFELFETIDAWCIIVLTMPMAALVKKLKPFTAMILGFFIASFSWIIIGLYGTITASIIGIALFALGEAIQAPRFYEYVSSLAPKDRIGTYMGFAFLPVAIGSFTAGPIADWLRLSYLQTNPSMMWFTVSGFGIVSTILMLLYNMFIAKKSDQTH
jgi:dipeptide/tripeptide permease